jgi:hypothetical protein
MAKVSELDIRQKKLMKTFQQAAKKPVNVRSITPKNVRLIHKFLPKKIHLAAITVSQCEGNLYKQESLPEMERLSCNENFN